MADMKSFLAKVAAGQRLTREDSEAAFDIIMSGAATPAQIGGFLMALRVRGETVDEIAGAVTTMRAKMLRVDAPPDAIDVVGTGGTPRAHTTSPPARLSWWRAPACRSPSTATARSRQNPGPPMSSSRWG